jgi:hypothetical protein
MNQVLYSFTEGPAIAAKIRHAGTDDTFIRFGLSFPLGAEYRSKVFKPEEDYCSSSVLPYLIELNELIDEKRRFTVRRADVCYGGSVTFIDTNRMNGKESIYQLREPLENSSLTMNEMKKISDALESLNKSVAFLRTGELYLSAEIPYNPFTEKYGASIDVFDMKIPKQVLGCRVELLLPEESYSVEKIEKPFDAVAKHVKFGRMLGELEDAHKEFLKLVSESRDRNISKVVKVVEV